MNAGIAKSEAPRRAPARATALLLAVAAACWSAETARARTVRVEPGVHDADRLAETFRSLEPGDTLLFRSGTHQVRGTIRPGGVRGTAQKPITIRGEPGARLLGPFRPESPQKDATAHLLLEKCAHVVIEDLEFEGWSRSALTFGNCQNMTVRRCHIHDYSNYALITVHTAGVTVEDCRIHGSGYEHGVYFSGDTTGVTVRGCTVSDTAINGIHINSSDNRDYLVESNVFHHNSREWGACVTLMGAGNVTIRNNVFFCNLGHIFTVTSNARDVRILHNAVYQPEGGRQGQVFVVKSPLRGFDVRGNVFATNAPAMDATPEQVEPAVFDWNLYGPLSGRQVQQWGQEKHGMFPAGVEFAAAPAWKDSRADLRLRRPDSGAPAVPRLDGLVPEDIEGNRRGEGGPPGAHASFAER